MKQLNYQGLLTKNGHGDSEDIIFLSSLHDPLAEELQREMDEKQVSVRYWVADRECTKDEVQENFIKRLCGYANCDFFAHYSEMTGYLWTDEECKIGGHDLLQELRSYLGKWLILEIDIH